MESEDVIHLRDAENGDEADKLEIKDGDLIIPNEGDTEIEEGQLISNVAEINAIVDSVVDEGQLPSDMITGEIGDKIELKGVGAPSENGRVIGREGIEDGELGIPNECATEIEEGQLISDAAEINANDDCLVEEGQLTSDIITVENGDNIELKDIDSPPENGCVIEREGSKKCVQSETGSISGVKRMRMTCDEQEPSVLVKYNCLSRQSRQKLEEVLREWSEWHVQNSSGNVDQNRGSETGEGMYFPALDIGTEKSSAVSFWMENEMRKPENNDFIPMEDASVPLYDRGFALGLISADGSSNLEGGSDLLDAPRCFNCGSYNHSLKECSKPRDNAAVNNSRKQLKVKRNQTAGSRNVSRYYQDTPGGKYEGLKPGVLDAETRRLLGLGEFDPPPWLNRMREIGYPPGYLEPEDEDLPSGITIYADEEIKTKEDTEEGEILDAEISETPRKKMSVNFPGLNAPIPKNADERIWAVRPSSSDRRNGDSYHSNYSSESYSRGRHREHNYRDLKEDDPFERASRYRYGDYDNNTPSHGSRKNAPASRSPSSGRSIGDRGRNDTLDSEDSSASRLYSSYSYNPSRRFPENNNDLEGSRGDQIDYSSRSRDKDDRYRHRSGR